MATSIMQRAFTETPPNEVKKINHYQHLEGKTLAEINLRGTAAKTVGDPAIVCLSKFDKPILVPIQPGAATLEEYEKLKAEKAKIEEARSGEKCWLTEDGLAGCGGELVAWNTLIQTEKMPCDVMALSLKEPKLQKIVIQEKKLGDDITLLSPSDVKDAEALLQREAGNLNGVRYLPRGALLIAPGGMVIKSYDLDPNSPSNNPQLIFKTLAADVAKIPKPKLVSAGVGEPAKDPALSAHQPLKRSSGMSA